MIHRDLAGDIIVMGLVDVQEDGLVESPPNARSVHLCRVSELRKTKAVNPHTEMSAPCQEELDRRIPQGIEMSLIHV